MTQHKYPITLVIIYPDLGQKYVSPKSSKITNSPSSSEILKTNPSGTISTMMKSVSLDDDNSNLAGVAIHSTNHNSKRSYPHTISRQSKKARRDKQNRHSTPNVSVAATRNSKKL
ncbi:hypothetical protein G6F19_013548 [Rhizopus arrhizus]|nr:hypothetical protein G6F19_013548 [Rhizopus arrhizus]